MTKTVLVAILDWGLGHATRCIPVIRELKNQNFRVIIGGSGFSLDFLKNEFRKLTFYDLPSYEIVYPENDRLWLSLLFQLPRILRRIKLENNVTQKIIEKESIDYVISDNRYGCYSVKIKSIFICHQLNLQMPRGLSFLSGIVNRLHLMRIKNFDEVWVPDERDGFKFSGRLSNNSLRSVRYIGILSRFEYSEKVEGKKYEIAGLVSGPEPQRSQFENTLRDQLNRASKKAILIKGKPGFNSQIQNGMLTEVDHLNSAELESVLMNCSLVVSRSGYSTIMDLCALGKKALFVPTPGQTEQEYLGEYCMLKGLAIVQAQNDFNLVNVLKLQKSIFGLPRTKPNSHLTEAIQLLKT
jgi:predicted glycosyltransferase